jgi:hypothetical protein
MLLQSENGASVEVKIVNYQFPDHGPDPDNPKRHYDANWLNAERLYFWLLAIEQGTAKQLIGGQEPEITFELLERSDSKATLRLDYMDWEQSERRWKHHIVVLELTYEDLKYAAAEWHSEIQHFPVRFSKTTLVDDSE